MLEALQLALKLLNMALDCVNTVRCCRLCSGGNRYKRDSQRNRSASASMIASNESSI